MNVIAPSLEKRKSVLKKAFKQYALFGLQELDFPRKQLDGRNNTRGFWSQLHNYVITDAIRDNKVLKFKVDYNYIKPEINKYREAERAVGRELDEKKLKKKWKRNSFCILNGLQPSQSTC